MDILCIVCLIYSIPYSLLFFAPIKYKAAGSETNRLVWQHQESNPKHAKCAAMKKDTNKSAVPFSEGEK
jgi:hypothetical protein